MRRTLLLAPVLAILFSGCSILGSGEEAPAPQAPGFPTLGNEAPASPAYKLKKGKMSPKESDKLDRYLSDNVLGLRSAVFTGKEGNRNIKLKFTGDSCSSLITGPGAARIEVRVIGGKQYVKGNDLGWRGLVPQATDDFLNMTRGKWVSQDHSGKDNRCGVDEMFGPSNQDSPKNYYINRGAVKLNGSKVIKLEQKGPKKSDKATVLLKLRDGNYYVVKSSGPGVLIEVSSMDGSVSIPTPPAGQTLTVPN